MADALPSFEETHPVNSASALPSFEDTKPVEQAAMPKFEDTTEPKEPSAADNIGTGIAGMARGATFGLSDAAASGMRKGATALGVPDKYLDYVAPSGETLYQAKEQHPVLSGATEFVGGIGGLKSLPKIGSSAIDGMIKMGLMGAGDEFSKSMMGHGDDVIPAVGHIIANGLFGLVFGSAAGKLEDLAAQKAKKFAEEKLGQKTLSYLAGIGHRASGGAAAATEEEALQQLAERGVNSEFFNPKLFQKGQSLYDSELLPRTLQSIKYSVAGLASEKASQLGINSALGAAAGLYAGDKIGNYIVPKAAQKVLGPILLKMASSGNFEGLARAIDYGANASRGYQAINKGINSIFQSGGGEAINSLSSELMNDKKREKIKEFIDGNGNDELLRQHQYRPPLAQQYAEGGLAALPDAPPQDPIAQHWPEQNMLLSASKMRVANYLNSIKQQKNVNKLPYDKEHKDKQHDREYNKAIDLANNPISILKHVKDGSLLPKHVSAFNSMYPELHQYMQKKLTERMTQGLSKDEKKPSYKTRQAMSLFLGTNLDSSLSQSNMMAAQAVFAQQKAQQAQRVQAKTNALSKMGMNAATAEQGREKRLNKN